MSRYTAITDYAHGSAERIGVLVCNLGTPEAPEAGPVRRYLKEFLSDPRVVEVPRPIWWLILNGVILNVRPKRSARAYAKVWTDAGSPLLVHSRAQSEALQTVLSSRLAAPVTVALGMRYGEPSIPNALNALRSAGCTRLIVLPLYPQYSASTTASIFDAVAGEFAKWRLLPELRFISQYYADPGYIDALAQSIESYWQRNGRGDHLLFSFHGIPQRYFDQGDPYHCHCHATAHGVVERLQLKDADWTLSFQSRVGREPWLKPYTDHTLEALGKKGAGRMDVVCPGFSADCIETLEEIDMENRELYLGAGGSDFHYIPCLNEDTAHIDALASLVASRITDWDTELGNHDSSAAAAARERALALGATR